MSYINIISIAKTASKKIGGLIRSMKFLCPEVALYLYKSTIGDAWSTVVMSGLVLLAATWNFWISCKNGSRGRSTCYSDRLHEYSVIIPRCYKDVYVNSFFPCTARLWNSLAIECFLLTYDLNSFKSRSNRHLLTVGSF